MLSPCVAVVGKHELECAANAFMFCLWASHRHQIGHFENRMPCRRDLDLIHLDFSYIFIAIQGLASWKAHLLLAILMPCKEFKFFEICCYRTRSDPSSVVYQIRLEANLL